MKISANKGSHYKYKRTQFCPVYIVNPISRNHEQNQSILCFNILRQLTEYIAVSKYSICSSNCCHAFTTQHDAHKGANENINQLIAPTTLTFKSDSISRTI
ncbi:hypothetical protein RF11_05547 [Thelohanellus kitauei]|uniref:Uncharacterized protein n=1 Tax=Thelohanellus kitauei TaxID=669202 RepID=A0A0C2NA90_THEKT|nr:hypothetical protein RF11_05547 [Thelohanellus kitauei]